MILSVTLGITNREYVFPLGATHGVLFIIYLALSLYASHKQKWSEITWFLLFLASLVPFAFIAVEAYIRREMNKEVKAI
ncbi:hypothetical protein NTGM5_30094 [Candidatus Nitrotoga sp. M5]|nr:hypothetical protein NTGM5_30094 [Candidatus Nitrotoga sp. M5]